MAHFTTGAASLLSAISLLGAVGASAGEPPAYVINEITVTDPARFKVYADAAPPTIAAFGGEFVVRGGAPEALAGGPAAQRVVILKFPSRAAAKAWRDSPAYRRILPIREASSTSTVYVVDGLAP